MDGPADSLAARIPTVYSCGDPAREAVLATQTASQDDPQRVKNRTLFFGDNLRILRERFPGEDGYFDLVYLDPPFNSRRGYNVLYREGVVDSAAQVAAFEDTWHWTADTQAQFTELVSSRQYPQRVSDLMLGLEKLVGHNDMMAYLTMMAARLVELHRVLKDTGSLYLHCDPTASHYLKIVMDAIFGAKNFRSEIIWQRSSAHNDTAQGLKQPGHVHDTLLFYTKSERWTWNPTFTSYSDEYVRQRFN